MRGYYSIEHVRNAQTKQYTNDVHRLSNSRRVLSSAYRARNTADSLKSVNSDFYDFEIKIWASDGL